MIVSVTGLSVLAVFVIGINLYCLVITFKTRKLHKPSNIAICSLLLAHLIQGIIVIPFYALRRGNVELKTLVCDIFRFSYMLTNYASCLSLLIVTFDRYMHLQFPLKYRVYSTINRMGMVLTCLWIYTLVLCLIPFTSKSAGSSCSYNPSNMWTTLMLILNTLIPFITILFLYIVIFKKARKVNKQQKLRRSLQIAKMDKSNRVFLIIFCYVICWGPSCVYYLVLSLCYTKCFSKKYHDSSTEEKYVALIMKILTFVDGIIAPLIYCIGNRSFKTASRRSRKKFYLVFKLQESKKRTQAA